MTAPQRPSRHDIRRTTRQASRLATALRRACQTAADDAVRLEGLIYRLVAVGRTPRQHKRGRP